VNNMRPQGLGQRVFGALLLLLAVSYGANLAYEWLRPLVPSLIVGLIVLGLFVVVLGRFRR
jgi:hypothetical protein